MQLLNAWPSALLFSQFNLLPSAINTNRFLPSVLWRYFIAQHLGFAGLKSPAHPTAAL